MLEQVASHVARQATLHRQPGQAPSCVVPAAPTTLNKAAGAGPRMLSTRSAYGPGHPLAVAHATTSDLPQTRCSYTRTACMASTPGAGCRYCPKKKCPTIYMQRRGFHGRHIVILLVVLVGTYPPGLFAQFRHGPIQPAQTLAKQQWSRGGPRALLTSLDVPIS